jgi:hypothetical protein
MTNVARIILAVLLFILTGYCVFGVLATLEPSTRKVLAWRSVYITIGAGSFLLGLWLVLIAWINRK